MVNTKEEQSIFTDFWAEFDKFIIKKGITAKYAKFYIIWAKKYVRFNNNEIPQDITESDIERFKDSLTADNKVMSWQIEQALIADAILRQFIVNRLLKRASHDRGLIREISFKDSVPSKK